jgi:SAM-dependent methyltransferase
VDVAEANATAAQGAGLNVRGSLLADAGFEPGRFSAVRVNQVIEHATDPLGLLRDVARVLTPGGVLSLATPNVESLTAKRLGERWHHLGHDGNAHVVLFSRDTLTRALGDTGFKPLRWQTFGLRLKVKTPGTAGRFWRTAARALTPFAEAAGRGGRIHVFAERL